ncbi:MAG: divalent metal cation transporter [Planctomycetes bacterium]|nr:divalent metal cation transporter [Planctomycetota bacterium]
MADAPAKTKSGLFKALGPGLLFAGTSVGVSELVQSTRAGADYSFALLIVIVLACVLKYPAFAFGPWYAHATGVSLLEGYRRQGKWALVLFLLVTLGTVFTVQATVTAVAASILVSVLGLQWDGAVGGLNFGPVVVVAGALLLACALLLRAGEYRWLDAINKVLILLLTVSTVVATALALGRLDVSAATAALPPGMLENRGELVRITGLIGWTPSAYDVAVWHSLWFLAHRIEKKHNPTLREARLDFNIGYWFSSFTSVCFLVLGAALMFQQKQKFPADAAGFANALIGLYAGTFGEWARPLLGVCAFSAMFSTVLSVTDSFPRVLAMLVARFREPEQAESPAPLPRRLYWTAMAVISLLALGILAAVPAPGKGAFTFKTLLDTATTLSFLSAPFIGALNHRAMFSRDVPEAMRPGPLLRWFSLGSIVFSVGFGLYFLYITYLAG